VSTDTGMLRYSPARSLQFYNQALDRVRAIPGVESAALATRVPFSVNVSRWDDIWIPGRHQPGQTGDTIDVTRVSADYFKTVGVAIVQGRGFTDDDRPETPKVAVVNETFAHRYWPDESAIGKTFHTRGGAGPAFQIVGVAADHKVSTVGEAPTPFIHVARSQQPNAYNAIIARTRGDANALLRDMRRELLALEPNLVFFENQTMEAEMGATLFPVRAEALVVSSVGVVAMLLAAIGLYGVIAYSVSRRTREIGIRMALGASASTVLRLVMRQGLIVAATGLGGGVVVGCAVALLARSQISGMLYGEPREFHSRVARGARAAVAGAAHGITQRSEVCRLRGNRKAEPAVVVRRILCRGLLSSRPARRRSPLVEGQSLHLDGCADARAVHRRQHRPLLRRSQRAAAPAVDS